MEKKQVLLDKKENKLMISTTNYVLQHFTKKKLPPRVAIAVLLTAAETVMRYGHIDNAGHQFGKHRVEFIYSTGGTPTKADTSSYIR